MRKINIYTDGACSANGKSNSQGSWGFCFEEDGILTLMKHGEITKGTTNNREELKAVLYALKELECLLSITDEKLSATIYTDSAYTYNICTKWVIDWYAKNWKRVGDKPIENLDIVQSLFNYLYYNKKFSRCKIAFEKVMSHSGNSLNELCDGLATKDFKKVEKIIKDNPTLLCKFLTE